MEFEDRVVAFIDILGWKAAIKRVFNNSENPAEVNSIIRAVAKIFEKNQDAQKHHNEVPSGRDLGIRFAHFSDSLVFSVPVNSRAGALSICQIASDVIRDVLSLGFIVRGGVVAGKLFHKEQFVFGPALVSAYEIESQRATFSRVIVDDYVREILKPRENQSCLLMDHLGNLVVNLFPIKASFSDVNEGTKKSFARIYKLEEILQAISSDVVKKLSLKEKDKWRYQAKLCALSLKQHGEIAKDWVKKFEDVAQTI